MDKEEVSIQLDFYSNDDIDYPTEDIEIPDLVQKEFMDKFFGPWNSKPEVLLSSLDSFLEKNFLT